MAGDRISSLPQEVLDSILILLPLKLAVQTSILSKTWRYKWTGLSHIVLNGKSIPSFITDLVERWRFIMTILHQIQTNVSVSTIEKFELSTHCKPNRLELNQWLQFLDGKRLKKFIIGEPTVFNPWNYDLPSSLFSCPKLEKLELSACEINPSPETHIEFNSLKVFALNNVKIKACVLERIILNCPLLEELTLVHIYPIFLRIENPNLKYLMIHSDFRDVCLAGCTSLLGVDISLREWSWNRSYDLYSNISGVISRLYSVRTLILNSRFLQISASDMEFVPGRFDSPLWHLVDFQLEDLRLNSLEQVRTCLCILRSAPYLEKLRLSISRNYSEPVLKFLDAQYKFSSLNPRYQRSSLNLNRLKEVKIIAVEEFDAESILAKFIREQSPILETMTVEHY